MKYISRISIVVAFLAIFVIAGCSREGVTGLATLEQCQKNYKCELKNIDTKIDLVGNSVFNGGGSIFDSGNFEPKIKNSNDKVATAVITATCNTIDRTETVSSGPVYIGPGEEKQVNMKFSHHSKDWRCIATTSGSKADSCLMLSR